MACKYKPDISDMQIEAMKWAITALGQFPKNSPEDPRNETHMMSLLACKGFELIVKGFDNAHDLLHERDAKIEELEEKLHQLNVRCDSLEMIVTSNDAVEQRFGSLEDKGESCES